MQELRNIKRQATFFFISVSLCICVCVCVGGGSGPFRERGYVCDFSFFSVKVVWAVSFDIQGRCCVTT